MSGRKETVVEVIKSLRRELALDADGVEEYVNRFSCAWRRANHRFSVKLAETRSAMTSAKTSEAVRKIVSPEVRKIVRKMVSNQKEKEHFPPDPLFEKNKKALPLSRECGARAHTHARGECPVDEPISLDSALSAAPLLGIAPAYVRWWHNKMCQRGWTNVDGSPVGAANWRPTLCAWYDHADEEEKAAAFAAERALRSAPDAPRVCDWTLCRERCANCRDGSCCAGVAVPPGMENPPFPPEECAQFAALSGKEGAR